MAAAVTVPCPALFRLWVTSVFSLFHSCYRLVSSVDFCFIQFVLFSYFQSHWFLLFFLLFPSLYFLCAYLFCFFWSLEVGMQSISLRPCSLFWCEHFNAINMFSFFFSPVFDVLRFCFYSFLCVFKVLFLFGPWFI